MDGNLTITQNYIIKQDQNRVLDLDHFTFEPFVYAYL